MSRVSVEVCVVCDLCLCVGRGAMGGAQCAGAKSSPCDVWGRAGGAREGGAQRCVWGLPEQIAACRLGISICSLICSCVLRFEARQARKCPNSKLQIKAVQRKTGEREKRIIRVKSVSRN